MEWNGLPTVIFGSEGISKEILFLIKEINRNSNTKIIDFIGFVGEKNEDIGKRIYNSEIIVSDDKFEIFSNKFSTLGVVIPIGTPKIKRKIFHKIRHIKNIVYPNLIHPNVIFDKDSVELGVGNIITSGNIVSVETKIENFNLINLNCTIGHGAQIGNYNVINPTTSISGDVKIGNECLIGTGATILQGINIEDDCIVGAGAVVVKNIESNKTVVGIPARRIR